MPLDGVWLPFLAKLAATVGVVIAASVAAARAGPFFGGLIASLPLTAGPAYLMLSFHAGDGFVAEAALSSVAAAMATAVFLVVLIRLAPRCHVLLGLAAALAAWWAALGLIRLVPWQPWAAAAAALLTYFVACLISRRVERPVVAARRPRRWHDLPLRALLSGVLVAGVVTFSDVIGPQATGAAALFPVNLTSLALVVQPQLGGAVASATMASALRGMVGFVLGLIVLQRLAVPLGTGAALVVALLTCLAWSTGLLLRGLRASRVGASRLRA